MDTEYLFCAFWISTNKYSWAVEILLLLEVSFRTFYLTGSFSLPLQEESLIFAPRKKCKAALSPESNSTLFSFFSMKAGDVVMDPISLCVLTRRGNSQKPQQALSLLEAWQVGGATAKRENGQKKRMAIVLGVGRGGGSCLYQNSAGPRVLVHSRGQCRNLIFRAGSLRRIRSSSVELKPVQFFYQWLWSGLRAWGGLTRPLT